MEKTLEQRIQSIEERNERVEADKKWERSPIRIGVIVITTYVFALLYIWLADTTNPFIGAVIPSIGFLFSTLSLKLLKRIWSNNKKGRT